MICLTQSNRDNILILGKRVPILIIENSEYLLMFDLPEYRRIRNTTYRITFNNSVFSLVEVDANGATINVIIDIPHIIYHGRTYVSLEFYMNELRSFLDG